MMTDPAAFDGEHDSIVANSHPKIFAANQRDHLIGEGFGLRGVLLDFWRLSSHGPARRAGAYPLPPWSPIRFACLDSHGICSLIANVSSRA